jgi:hypothetical protein
MTPADDPLSFADGSHAARMAALQHWQAQLQRTAIEAAAGARALLEVRAVPAEALSSALALLEAIHLALQRALLQPEAEGIATTVEQLQRRLSS